MPIDREAEHDRGEPVRGLREQPEAVAQEAEGADLVEHADEQHGATDRRLGRGIWQPGVERPQRRLDGERDEEAEEQPALVVACQVQVLQRGVEHRVAADHVEADHGTEHEQPAEKAVQQELQRRVRRPRRARAADDEVHRDQHGFEEDVEQEDVGRREDADEQRLHRRPSARGRSSGCAWCSRTRATTPRSRRATAQRSAR